MEFMCAYGIDVCLAPLSQTHPSFQQGGVNPTVCLYSPVRPYRLGQTL